jgi:hypothetical protein
VPRNRSTVRACSVPGGLAGAASTRIKRVFYTAAVGEVNHLTISLPGVDYTLVDLGATVATAPACTAVGETATCPADCDRSHRDWDVNVVQDEVWRERS